MTDAGWLIVGFTDSQMSAERVRRLQDASAGRYDKWRAGHPEHPKGKRPSNGAGNGVANDSARPTALPTTREEAEGGGGGAAGLGPAAAAQEETPNPTRRDLGRMVRTAPNVSLRRAYLSAFTRTWGSSYPDSPRRATLHPAMATMVRAAA
jgi:hypothetical protein